MIRRLITDRIVMLLLVVSAVDCCDATAPVANAKPHVVVILADDLGWGDVGCYGGKIPTPHLDRLAGQGIRFTDSHSPSAVCSPTRYGLLTGRYAWRSKLKRGVLGGLSPALIEPGRMTLASLLHDAGYYTAAVGKWHLGMDWVVKPGASVTELGIEPREQVFNVDYTQPIKAGPNSVGFDYFYGISASLDMVPYTFIENDRVVAAPTEDRKFLMTRGKENGGTTRAGPAAPGFEATDVLPMLVDKACGVIDQHAAESTVRPLFLYVPLTSPHTPILPNDEWSGKSKINAYADFVMQTDAAIGKILAALERAGMTDDTLIVVTSDNGCSPQANFAELASHGHSPSGPYRGHKADIFEGGHRVPLIVRWPAGAIAGVVSHQTICLTDLLATVAELVGKPLPPSAGEDSISFLGTLSGEGGAGREQLISHSIDGTFAIREKGWKLILAPDSGGWSEPRPGSEQAQGLPSRQLYFLPRDPGERKNLLPQRADRAEELRLALERVVERGRSTPGEPQQNHGAVEIERRN